MRIKEILESKYNEPRHTLAVLAASVPESSLAAVDSSIDKILQAYEKVGDDPEKYVQQLEKLQDLFLDSLMDVSMWDSISDSLEGDEQNKLYQDFIEIEDKLERTIQQIKQDNNLREDLTIAKAANGELSPMGSTQKKVDRRDRTRQRVEQIMNGTKK